jgi:hypothetical protein
MSLMTDGVGRYASFNEICAVDLPEETKSYKPVPNKDLVEFVKRKAGEHLPEYQIKDERFILTDTGQRMLGMIRLARGDLAETLNTPGATLLTLLLRNSYDKSDSVAFGSGPSGFGCFNGIFQADDFVYTRKHTRNVWRDLDEKADSCFATAAERYVQRIAQLQTLKQRPLTDEQGWALLGIARGKKILTPTMESVALTHWDTPPEEFQEDRNLYGWFQAVSWALGQKAHVSDAMSRHADLHKFVFPTQTTNTVTVLPLGVEQQTRGALIVEA